MGVGGWEVDAEDGGAVVGEEHAAEWTWWVWLVGCGEMGVKGGGAFTWGEASEFDNSEVF